MASPTPSDSSSDSEVDMDEVIDWKRAHHKLNPSHLKWPTVPRALWVYKFLFKRLEKTGWHDPVDAILVYEKIQDWIAEIIYFFRDGTYRYLKWPYYPRSSSDEVIQWEMQRDLVVIIGAELSLDSEEVWVQKALMFHERIRRFRSRPCGMVRSFEGIPVIQDNYVGTN